MQRQSLIVAAMAIVAFGLSCTDAIGPAMGPKGIQVISGGNVVDTVDAQPSRALIVEMHDTTGVLAAPGTLVRFEGVGFPGGPREVYVSALDGTTGFRDLVTGTTDQQGRTGAFLKLGVFAGTQRIAISAPTLGLADTLRFTVAAGAPASMAFGPPDNAMYVGRSFTLVAKLGDRYGNPRPEPVVFTTSASGITVTNAGVVTASTVGRYTITGSGGGRTGTAFVSVVPQGRIVGWKNDQIFPRMITADLDGSIVREITRSAQDSRSHPMWIPGTNRIIYTVFSGGREILRTADDADVPMFTDFLANPPATMTRWGEGSPSANGAWMYFSAGDSQCGTAFSCLYRAKPDGTAPELLGGYIGVDVLSWRPAPSPDGSRVAFVTSSDAGAIIKVFDVATKTVSSWSVDGQNPSWSPNGALIVYNNRFGGPLRIMNADGTNQRVLSVSNTTYPESLLSWSSDSKWVLARNAVSLDFAGTMNLIEVSTGLVLPLAPFSQLEVASLKP
jgi:hypothetical protein